MRVPLEVEKELKRQKIAAYVVGHLPIIKSYAVKIGLVDIINELVPSKMDVDPGTIFLGLVMDTLSGRTPLYRLDEFFQDQDTELLLGKRITHANLMLKQIIETPRTTFTLVPNQHIGVWEVGFKPQLLMREYLTRRGVAKLRSDQHQPARCPLLGYELNYATIEGSKIPSRFLKTYNQPELGIDGYDAGAEILTKFFKEELQKYLDKDLLNTGKRIIDACLSDASIDEYNEIVPMSYRYSFNNMEDYEQDNEFA